MSRLTFITCLLGVLAACRGSQDLARAKPLVADTSARPVRAGTYALRLCRVVCDRAHPNNVIRSGWVMLDSAAIDTTQFPDSVWQVLELEFGNDRLPPNGCFELNATRPDVPTYAGDFTGGLLRWPRGGADSISFLLYRSADADYEVRAVGTDGGFHGAGHSEGAGAASVDYPDDIVVGEYVGPPDQDRCREAGLAFLAALRAVDVRHTSKR